MAYDWKAIKSQQTPEEAYYRLLGDMLHRRANDIDLQSIREFLSTTVLDESVWLSLGEGLFQTTSGASVGYRMWLAWSRSMFGNRFDEADQLEAWRRFQEATSDALEFSSDAHLAIHESACIDDDQTQRTSRHGASTAIAQNPTLAIALIPSGPHTIRVFGEVYESIDEFAILKLLTRGVLFQIEVLFGMRWVAVTAHPGFELLTHRLRDEAMTELATTERVRAETTQPGTM